MPLKIVLLICNIASVECSDATAVSRYVLYSDSGTPGACLFMGQVELARMNGLYDQASQRVVIKCGR